VTSPEGIADSIPSLDAAGTHHREQSRLFAEFVPQLATTGVGVEKVGAAFLSFGD